MSPTATVPHLLRATAAVARIRTQHTSDHTRVILAGRVTANDMGRLERACAEALTSRSPRLEIDIRQVTHTDGTARAVLEQLASRGVVIRVARTGGPDA